ncbi:alkaline phosphatase family protein [bacterium]|nr:alkaline phosphatase family protein [bacterium]
MGERLARKVLLIGWDAADWKVINPLMDSGQMPALQSIVDHGVIGNLATLDPPMSPMLWTSIATGMHADKHGIMNFTEPSPQKEGIRPVMSTSRKVKAVWNILNQNGLKPNVVSWWPSHPAEPIDGIMVSNFYQRANAPVTLPWPMPPGTVHPPEKAPEFDRLRIHPAELTAAHLLPFVPDAGKVDQEKDQHLASLSRIIADCSTVHAAATWILENEPWDFMAVYYDAIDHFCHGFMNYHPPKLKWIPKKQYELYKHVVSGAYRFHDMMLGRLLQLAGEETTVVLVSDHGFHSDHLRPRGFPKEPAGPAWQHRSYGIFAMKGPHVKQDERIYGARLLDVTPTVLCLFGLPSGEDMDGHPLIQSFDRDIPVETIPSWEAVPGGSGMLDKNLRSDPYAEREAMEQLVALGYVDPPGADAQKSIDRTVNESSFFLARVHIDKNRHDLALPLLEKLHEDHPDQVRYAFHLAKCYQSLGRSGDCKRVTEAILVHEKREYPQLDLLRGTLALSEGLYHGALEYFAKAEKADPRLPSLHRQIGRTYMKLGKFDAAEKAFKRALNIDPDSAHAHHEMARVYMKQRKLRKAATHALDAVGLLYHFPQAHYTLAVILAKLGDWERAAQALEVCLTMVPGDRLARRLLVRLYRVRLNRPEKAQEQESLLDSLGKRMKNKN